MDTSFIVVFRFANNYNNISPYGKKKIEIRKENSNWLIKA